MTVLNVLPGERVTVRCGDGYAFHVHLLADGTVLAIADGPQAAAAFEGRTVDIAVAQARAQIAAWRAQP